MSAKLINGNGFSPVLAQDDADFYAGLMGSGGMLNIGNMMAASTVDATTIRLSDGVYVNGEGRRIQIRVGEYEDFTIPSGSEGVTRTYHIGYRIYVDGSGNELCEPYVTTSWPSGDTSLREGNTETYVRLYTVTQTGYSITAVTPVFTVIQGLGAYASKIAELEGAMTSRFQQPGNAGMVVYGAGYVTTSGKEIWCNFTPIKPLSPSIRTFTVTSMYIRARQNGKYLYGTGGARASIPANKVRAEINSGGINIIIANDAAFTGVTNNAPIGIEMQIAGRFS